MPNRRVNARSKQKADSRLLMQAAIRAAEIDVHAQTLEMSALPHWLDIKRLPCFATLPPPRQRRVRRPWRC